MQKISFHSSGYTIVGDLLLPPTKNPPGVLLIHGAGHSHKEKFADMQQALVEKGFASLAIDCTGVGESSGDFEEGSLAVRLQNAQDGLAALRKYADPAHISILGSSMGGFVATVVGWEEKLKNIILLAGAAYSPEAEKKQLDATFTQIIRSPKSWENSRSFAALENFSGRVLVLYGAEDTTIPEEIKNRYRQIASRKGEWYTIATAGHNLITAATPAEEKASNTVREHVVHFLTSMTERISLTPLVAERLTREQAVGVAHAFGKHMRAGLEGTKLSLMTIPTHLRPVDKGKLQVGEEAVVAEIGGTHFRSSIVKLDSAKDPEIAHEMLAMERKKKYDSAEEFFDELAVSVKAVANGAHPKALGIIWSAPTQDLKPTPEGIDGISVAKLPKELVIPGVDKKYLGDFVIEALQRAGMDIPNNFPRVVANDTAAVLLANNATFGGIVATGFNFAFLHNKQMYNLEAGRFSEVPRNALTQAVDNASENPGDFAAEKQISGQYIGPAFTLALKELGISDREYTSADMSAVLSGELFADNANVRKVAENLRDRSAQLVGAMIAGAVKEFPEDFPDQEIIIPIDGSFFGKTPGYQEAVESHATDLLDSKKRIVTKYVRESGMKGAALAALGEVK